MQNTAKYIITVIVSLAVGVAGAGLSFWLGQKQGIGSVKNQMEQSKIQTGESKPLPPIEILSINGKIESIENNTISLDITVTDFLTKSVRRNVKKETRKITVNDKTEFLRAYYLKAPTDSSSSNSGEKSVLPKLDSLKFTDLKVGDSIIVFATEDIAAKQEFIASKIQLLVVSE